MPGKGYIIVTPSPNHFIANTFNCSNCDNNDRMCYTSNPPKYKCTVDNTFHFAYDSCDKYKEQEPVYLYNELYSIDIEALKSEIVDVILSEEDHIFLPKDGEEDYDTIFENNEALEKQIPKVAEHEDGVWSVCPCCGGSVCNDSEHAFNKEVSYCEHCGQAIDWENSEFD